MRAWDFVWLLLGGWGRVQRTNLEMGEQFLKSNSSPGDIGGLPIKLHAAGQAAFEPGDLAPPHLKRDSLVVCGDAQDVCERGAHGVRPLIAG